MRKNQEPETIPVLDWLKERKSFLRIFKIRFFEQYRYFYSLSLFPLLEFLLFLLALVPVCPTSIAKCITKHKNYVNKWQYRIRNLHNSSILLLPSLPSIHSYFLGLYGITVFCCFLSTDSWLVLFPIQSRYK